jgi:hypothetical protein
VANFTPTPQSAITSPTPGSTLTSSSATFQWSSATGVTDYFLYVGNSLGTNNIYAQDEGVNLSATVNGLPTDGSTLYVRLWWQTSAGWQYADYTYRAFTVINYSITVSASPSAGGTVSGGGTYASGSSCTVTATANSGYTFANWTESGSVVSSSASYTFTVNGNRNLVANFTPTPQSAITSPTPGSTLTSSSATFQWSSATGVTDYFLYVGNSLGTNNIYDQDEGVNLSAAVNGLPTDGSTLYVRLWWQTSAGWQYADYTYRAFTVINYTITVSASPSAGGTVSGGGTFASGSSRTVTATANSGYTFANWTENGGVVSSSASYTFTLNANRNLVANFTVNYTITVSASPSAGGTVSGGGTFASGSSRTVTATANSGYTFANWTENGSVVSSSASYTFTLNANRNLVANFTVNYTITVSASPSAGGRVSGGGTFASGTSQTVMAAANSGYTFVNWTENGSVVSPSASYNFTLNANRNLVANFTVIIPPEFGRPSVSGGALQTVLSGLSAGETVVLQVSSDLKNWTPLKTNSVLSGTTMTFTNTINPAIKGQYFRAVVQ